MTSREELNLQKIINQYLEQDTKKKELEKELKSKNAFIKNKLAEMEQDIYETDKSKAVITYQNRVSMDDNKVIEILKDNLTTENLKQVIKTKEYVDYESLESIIYNGTISADKLEPAQVIKTITTLKVTPLKKKEDNND